MTIFGKHFQCDEILPSHDGLSNHAMMELKCMHSRIMRPAQLNNLLRLAQAKNVIA